MRAHLAAMTSNALTGTSRGRGRPRRPRQSRRRTRPRRLSYANMMSTIAVFGMLTGGGAYAASKIGSSDIAKGAVLSKHIGNGQVKKQDVANSAITHFELGALVRQNGPEDCTLIRGRGATGTSSNLAKGFCTVAFNRDISKCVYSAGLTSPGYPGLDISGEIWAFAAGPDSVAVRTANDAGTTKTPLDFSVIVVC